MSPAVAIWCLAGLAVVGVYVVAVALARMSALCGGEGEQQ